MEDNICETCEGRGKVRNNDINPPGALYKIHFDKCDECHGSGKMTDEYYIIYLDGLAWQKTLLFWKPKGLGYTADINQAGLFDKKVADNINNKGRDLAITRKELEKLTTIYTVVEGCLSELQHYKKMVKTNDN